MDQGVIKELATKYDLPEFVVEDIVKSQFKFVHTQMQNEDLVKIRLHHFGVFKVKPKRLYSINEKV